MPNWIGFVLGFCLISDSYPVYKEIHFLFFRINKLYLISLMGWRILIFFVYEINTFFGAMLVITTIENYSIMSVFLLSQCTSVLMTSMYRSLSPHQFVRLGLFVFFCCEEASKPKEESNSNNFFYIVDVTSVKILM